MSSLLDYYTTDGGIWVSLFGQKTRVTADHVSGIVEGDAVVYGVIHPLSDVVHASYNIHQTVG